MIFAIDLDGTLLGTDKKVRHASKIAIAKAQKKGHLVIPITGRSFVGVQDIIKELKIKKYVVINNGSSIYNIKTKKFFNYPPVGQDVVKKLMNIAKEEEAEYSLHAVHKTIRCSFAPKGFQKLENMDWASTLSVTAFRKEMMKMKIMQVSMKSTESVVNKWHIALSDKYFGMYKVYTTSRIYLDINYKKVSKYEALLWIIDKEKLSLDDLVAFGDSDNDINMIIGAKIGIAMANATQLTIEKADEVIANNDTDAIANKINELIK